jgi:hypothetical protein
MFDRRAGSGTGSKVVGSSLAQDEHVDDEGYVFLPTTTNSAPPSRMSPPRTPGLIPQRSRSRLGLFRDLLAHVHSDKHANQ